MKGMAIQYEKDVIGMVNAVKYFFDKEYQKIITREGLLSCFY